MNNQIKQESNYIFNKEEIKEKFTFALNALAERGWFVSLWETPLTAIPPLVNLFLAGHISEGDKLLCKHFDGLIEKIKGNIIKQCPDRKEIILSAFDAHNSGSYILSIPVLLAQTDGIGKEIFSTSVYSQRNDKVEDIKKFVEGKFMLQLMTSYYWELVGTTMPINATQKNITKFKDPLNRNAILHGECVNYATYVNSCKAISWFQYILSFKDSELWSGKKKSKNGGPSLQEKKNED